MCGRVKNKTFLPSQIAGVLPVVLFRAEVAGAVFAGGLYAMVGPALSLYSGAPY